MTTIQDWNTRDLGSPASAGTPVPWGRRGHCQLVDEGAAGRPTKLETLRLADDADRFAPLAHRGLSAVPRTV